MTSNDINKKTGRRKKYKKTERYNWIQRKTRKENKIVFGALTTEPRTECQLAKMHLAEHYRRREREVRCKKLSSKPIAGRKREQTMMRNKNKTKNSRLKTADIFFFPSLKLIWKC